VDTLEILLECFGGDVASCCLFFEDVLGYFDKRAFKSPRKFLHGDRMAIATKSPKDKREFVLLIPYCSQIDHFLSLKIQFQRPIADNHLALKLQNLSQFIGSRRGVVTFAYIIRDYKNTAYLFVGDDTQIGARCLRRLD